MLKRTVPILIASFVGFLLVVSKFSPPLKEWENSVKTWFDILAAFAFILGGGNLMLNHLRKVSDRHAGWGYSVITLAAFLITLVLGLIKFGVPPNENYPQYSWSGDYMAEGGGLWWIYTYVYLPLSATMFASLAFYISSAAFRAFRAKNIEASLLLLTAVTLLLAQTSNGARLTDFLPESLAMFKLESIKQVQINLFNTIGTRAIMIGIALGVVSTSLKVLLGVDRSYLGSD